jgi:hypothetical protein
VEQTQALRNVIAVAQRTVALEAMRMATPLAEITGQLDAVK